MMKILLCDINQSVSTLIEKILNNAGHEVFTAQDGLKAKKILDEEAPDLLITEIQIPFISGFELIAYAKSKDPHISTMILSRVNAESYITQAFKIGADDYITKPFNPEMILTRIKKAQIQKV